MRTKRERRTEPTEIVWPADVIASPITAPDGTTIRPALVERADWADPDDLDPHDIRGQREKRARRVQGFRRVSVIWNLHQRSPREITQGHLKAAAQFTRDYEVGHEGAKAGGGRGMADDTPIVGRQLMALGRYRRALEALGPTLSSIVCAVVLANWTVAQLAGRLRVSPDRAQGRLAAALDRLCDHYQPPKPERPAPAAVAPVAGVGDLGLPPLPQERTGRWRASQGA